ncbi:MAG: PSD1 domain-containing protein [Cyclobacteriaceae bacterium]|nr:PSD1 domain-containing protein [Cyclobacteriaceae bacterium]
MRERASWQHLPLISLSLFCGFVLFSACDRDQKKVNDAKTATISYNLHVRPVLSDKCFACHGPDANTREAGLRLDIAEAAYAALKESPGAHALVPGNPQSSEAFLRITSSDPSVKMPPPGSNLMLSDEEIKIIERWIKEGAVYEPHWAFVPPVKAPLPKVKKSEWPTVETDFFILEKIEKAGLKPNPPADKERLLRRLSIDLTGLPPSEELIATFLNDRSPDAYEKMVDKLLASKTYGEKMAVHWMDVARYADSYGYQDDNYRSQWPWRDWVIHAFNRNMPYDQFVTWQIAGDLLPDTDAEKILATAFNRNHKYTEEGGVIDEEYRVEYIADKINTITKGMLGLTLECARCHDHKYDPLSQKEYYEFFAFFNSTPEKGYEGDVSVSKPAKPPLMSISHEDIQGILSFINAPDTSKITVSVMGEMDTLRPTHILERGHYENLGQEVGPNTPETVLPFSEKYPRNRLGLTQWMFDPSNPLTARVFVNQIWQELFGRGLVETTGDFGLQGELPTHQELLDWLAVDFMEHQWDVKRLVKHLVSSSTYKQSAVADKNKLASDPDNILLSRAPRIRLKAEFIRDMVLYSSGLLVPEIGGPSVKPYQPEGIWEAATSGRGILATYRQDKGEALYRRGLYTFIKLTVPPPSMIIFDASNRDQCEVNRSNTNTPLQALVMMNDPLIMEASRVLAANIIKETNETELQISTAFRKIISRDISKKELSILSTYYKEQWQQLKDDPDKASQLLSIGEYPLPASYDAARLAALTLTLHTMYNMDEAITKT